MLRSSSFVAVALVLLPLAAGIAPQDSGPFASKPQVDPWLDASGDVLTGELQVEGRLRFQDVPIAREKDAPTIRVGGSLIVEGAIAAASVEVAPRAAWTAVLGSEFRDDRMFFVDESGVLRAPSAKPEAASGTLATVTLPQGATITSLDATFEILQDDVTMNVDLVRARLASRERVALATVGASGASSDLVTASTSEIGFPSVDTDAFAYLLRFRATGGNVIGEVSPGGLLDVRVGYVTAGV